MDELHCSVPLPSHPWHLAFLSSNTLFCQTINLTFLHTCQASSGLGLFACVLLSISPTKYPITHSHNRSRHSVILADHGPSPTPTLPCFTVHFSPLSDQFHTPLTVLQCLAQSVERWAEFFSASPMPMHLTLYVHFNACLLDEWRGLLIRLRIQLYSNQNWELNGDFI